MSQDAGGRREYWCRGSQHAEFTGKQATTVLQISAVGHGEVARAVRAPVLGERPEAILAEEFMLADDEPAASQQIVPAAGGARNGRIRTEHQPIQRHEPAGIHVSVSSSAE